MRFGQRPRIMVLSSTYPRWKGDPEPAFVHELCRRLGRHFRIVVVGPHAAGARRCERMDGVAIVRYRYAPSRMETLVNEGGIVTNLQRARWKMLLVPCFVLSQWWVARKIMSRRPTRCVHAHWALPQGVVAAWLCRRHMEPKFMITSHGADLFALRGKWFAHFRRWGVGRAAATTVVSHVMRAHLQIEGCDVENVHVMPMGIDTVQRFTTDESVIRSPHELLFVGRLVEKKGLTYLLDALPLLAAIMPQVSLTIAGFGPEENVLRAQVAALGLRDRVRFLGAVPQTCLPGLYRKAALFVAPFVEAVSGDQEGLGLVVAEAAACGCPVVVGDVPAAHDLLDDASGQFVQPRDTVAFAAALADLLRDESRRCTMASIARERVRQQVDWEVVTEGYASLINEVI